MQAAQFGPAGNPDAFYAAGHKASSEMPAWLAGLGLDAYEYQCSRGVTVHEETARAIGEEARRHGIRLSVHAPYYINLATEDPTIAANTTGHILKSLTAARWLGADRVAFHIGGPGKQTRGRAIERAKALFAAVLEEADKQGLLEGICLAPETMGKQKQIGNLEEVLAFCAMSEWTIPTLDFGHLHCVTGGRYTTREEYEAAFDLVAAKLGEAKAAAVHIHFSRIEFTKAGEKRHWTFADAFGPPHEPLLEVIAARGYAPRIVCESAGTQAADAKTMQAYYRRLTGA